MHYTIFENNYIIHTYPDPVMLEGSSGNLRIRFVESDQ